MNALNTFPKNLKIIFSIFPSTMFFAFLISAFVTEAMIGRPSSTHALGYFAAVIWSGIIAIIGFIFGIISSMLLKLFCESKTIFKKNPHTLSIALIVLIILSVIAGCALSYWSEQQQRPHVIADTGILKKLKDLPVKTVEEIEAKYVFAKYNPEEEETQNILWNDKKVFFNITDDDSVQILNSERDTIASTDLSKYDYARTIYALPVALQQDNRMGLALLVGLRATSRRSMLLVYDYDGKLIYQELLNRGRCREDVLASLIDEQGSNYILVNVGSPTIYSCQ
jgi:hypothetical protein